MSDEIRNPAKLAVNPSYDPKTDERLLPRCDVFIEGGLVAFPCSVRGKDHDGPCSAPELPRSVARRRQWLVEQETAKAEAEKLAATLNNPAQWSTTEVPADPRRIQELAEAEVEAALAQNDPIEVTTNVSSAEGMGVLSTMRRPVGETGAIPQDAIFVAPRETAESMGPQPPARQLTAPTRTRPGDQPLPTKRDAPYVADLLIAHLTGRPYPPVVDVAEEIAEGLSEISTTVSIAVDLLEARKKLGIERYGTPLQAFNGRNVEQDALEESIDLVTYLYQAVLEGKLQYASLFEQAKSILFALVQERYPEAA